MAQSISEQDINIFLSGEISTLSNSTLSVLIDFSSAVIRFRYGQHKVREADIKGIALDAIVSAWRSRHTFRGDAKFTTWLARIVVRATDNHLRESLESTHNSISLDSTIEHDDGWKELQVASSDNIAEIVRVRMLWDYATKIVPERQLRAFQMLQEGYSEAEIGNKLVF